MAFSSFAGDWSRIGSAIDYRLDVARESSFINYVYQNLSAGNVTSYNVTRLIPNTILLLASAIL
jgi:hypothetical protein